MTNSTPHRPARPTASRSAATAALALAAVAMFATASVGCHATSAGLDGMDWLSDGLADLDDTIQRDLDRR